MKKANAFHEPLHPLDTANHTYGCRHTNPTICGRNYMPGICAFVRDDGICIDPPMSWPKQYSKLKRSAENSN